MIQDQRPRHPAYQSPWLIRRPDPVDWFRLPGGIEYRCDHMTANQRAIEVMAALVESGDLICEDVKSEATRKDRTYINKAKQMKECLGFPVREV